MSLIASFYLLPKSKLDGLREAAVVIKRWFGKPKDTYWDYLWEHCVKEIDYKWSGSTLVDLFTFLEERGISFDHSEYDDLTDFLCEQRDCSWLILTEAHKRAYLSQLSTQTFVEELFLSYFHESFGEVDDEIGRPILDGIDFIRAALNEVDTESVVLLNIG